MKIQIASDLHLEFRSSVEIIKIIKDLAKSNPDILILAGDITSHKNLNDILTIFSNEFNHIIFVNGNHECYGTHIDNLRLLRDRIQNNLTNLNWLDNNEVTINNQKFIGCTLWFRNDPLNQIYEKYLNDFSQISNYREWVYKENEKSINYIDQNCDENTIVITHHLPSYKSVNSKYQGDNLNRFFVCEMDEIIEKRQPKYWIHGHSHHKFDYNINLTRIIANPLGYPGESGLEDFNWNKIIEI